MDFTSPASSSAYEPRSVSGWALRPLCELDAASAHFLSHVLGTSTSKRQAIFAAVAEMEWDSQKLSLRLMRVSGIECRDHNAQIARALLVLKPQQILHAIYGSVPDGLRGTLRRVGPDPFGRPALYRDLYALFAKPDDHRRADLVRLTSGRLREPRLEVALALDLALLHPRVFEGLADLDDVERLNAAVSLIRATVSTATIAELRRSLAELPPDADFGGWVTAWLRRSDRPLAAPPKLADQDLIVLGVADLAAASRRFSNCLKDRVLHVASGRDCYVVTDTAPGAVAELRRTSVGGWVLCDIVGPMNDVPDPHLAAEMRRKLEAAGVVSLASAIPSSHLEPLAHLLSAFDLIRDWPAGRQLRQRLREIEQAA